MHFIYKRQGQMVLHQPYFYTQTIHDHKKLLVDDNLKMIIINSWQYLVRKKLIKIFGYVIMPNHLHLIWKMLKMNGKEMCSESFSKFTGHEFKRYLINENKELLTEYYSDKSDREFQFWKRDPLAIPLSGINNFIQKLKYIHENPVKSNLTRVAEDYRWSSAGFYDYGYDEFGILTDFRDLL